ncbi:MAG: ATPase, T2SS/T4P/T4SS family [Thermotogota bacterium]|nr:ATPase, T2SS/T4P/T4SS family [Thermotogota bacterium]
MPEKGQRFQYKRLGEILTETGYVTKQNIQTAITLQKKEKKPLGQILVEKGYVSWQDIAQALSKQYDLPYMETISELEFSSELLSLIGKQNCEKWRIMPYEKEDNKIKVLTDEVSDINNILRTIKFMTNLEPSFIIVPKPQLDSLLKEYFGSNIQVAEDLKKSLEAEELEENIFELSDLSVQSEEKTAENSGPIIKLVNQIILQAIEQDVSDIHIEPYEKLVRVRFRVDGMLRKIAEYPSKMHHSVISRIKILSDLDIAERRLPQDGKFYLKNKGEQYDFRVSTMPTVNGEKVVLRLLKVSNSNKRLTDLGFSDYNYNRLEYLLKFPYGIILVTGPTGSGKSTTLVGIINHLKNVTQNIVTVEDPVEYSISGVNQCQTHAEIGLNFARFLRAILRQDPDIIMVGEIRDKETAQLAIEASMTGHLVLSTLHTNTASAAVNRLLNLGIEPDLLGVSLLGVMGQRLVRTICPECKKKRPLLNKEFREMAKLLLPNEDEYYEYYGSGCQTCRKTGYKGRTGIHEVLIVDKKIRQLMNEGAPESQIEAIARKSGMRTMFEDGILKSISGETTIDEIKRVAINV